VLTDLDDLLVHQSGQTIAYPATTDLRFFERFYFNVHDQQGRFSVSTGLGAYPNMNSMDSFACAIAEHDQKQYNARFFRRLRDDRTNTTVGAMSFQVLEPMHRWRMTMGPNPYGIEFDLEMTTRFAPWETRVHHASPDGVGVIFDMGHFVQSCSYAGTVTIGGVTYSGSDLLGVRDRSWGVRPLAGIPQPGNASIKRALHFWWNPQFSDSAFFLYNNEDPDGGPMKLDGGIVGGRYDGRTWVAMDHSLTFDPGSQLFRGGEFTLTDDHGDQHRLTVEPALPGLYLLGGGYGGLSQGKFMGDHDEGEVWDLSAASDDELARYVNGGQSPTDKPALFTKEDGEQGYGMAEYSIRPDYRRYP
jgi:hypothetical protein